MVVFGASAQDTKLFTKEEAFIADAQTLMARARTPLSSKVSAEISGVLSNLQADEKSLIYKTSKLMYEKGYRPTPQFEDYLGAVVLGYKSGAIRDQDLKDLLNASFNAVKDCSPATATPFFTSARTYAESRAIYKFKDISGLYLKQGRLSFGYKAPIKAEPSDASFEPEDPNETQAAEDTMPNIGEVATDGADEAGWDIETSEPAGSGETAANDPWAVSGDDWGDPSGDANSDDWGTDGGTPIKEPVIEKKSVTEKYPNSLKKNLVQYDETAEDSLVVEGPYLALEGAVLEMRSPNDTVEIRNTSGYVVYSKTQGGAFTGKGGTFDWSSVGIPSTKAYAELDRFNFKISKPEFKAKNVKMYYPEKLDSAVRGELQFASLKQAKRAEPIMPFFKSYQSNINVKGFSEQYAKSIVFTGGFSLRGRKVTSESFSRGFSTIAVYKNDSLRMRLRSKKQFEFTPEFIRNQLAEMVVYLNNGNDSIVHRGMLSRLRVKDSLYFVGRKSDDFKYGTFLDTYHKVEVDADYVKINFTTDTMDISVLRGRNDIPAFIESYNYFDQSRLARLQGIYKFNPLISAVGYHRMLEKPSLEFASADLSKNFNLGANIVQTAMAGLHERGYVTYEPEYDWVKIQRKGLLYTNANNRRSDYDRIRIISRTGSLNNMGMNFNKGDLVVRGVVAMRLSETPLLTISATPSDSIVIIKKGLDMEFKGKMDGKIFDFHCASKPFQFFYDSFKVEMELVDSMQMYVMDTIIDKRTGEIKSIFRKRDSTGKLMMVDNTFKNFKATYYLNHPKNKSGTSTRREVENYPILAAAEGGLVTFDKKSILDNAYSESVKFEMDAFTLDKMDRRNPSELYFGGTFKTSGIMPDFEEKIHFNEKDRSLGFTHVVPDSGYALYEGKGKLLGASVTVDSKGIRATSKDPAAKTSPMKKAATIKYLAADVQSDDFVFYPDSVKANGKESRDPSSTFTKAKIRNDTIANGVRYPGTEMQDYELNWDVKKNDMMFKSKSTSFEMYTNLKDKNLHDSTKFKGTLGLTPDGLRGNGKFETEDAVMASESFNFREDKFNANHSNISVKSDNKNVDAVTATDVKINYNMNAKVAELESEVSGNQAFEFPYAKYKTSLAKATWLIDKDILEFKIDESKSSVEQGFASTDSTNGVQFSATYGKYDIKENLLSVGGVPYILVVDSKVIPNNGEVTIRKDGQMDMLREAQLDVSAATNYFHLNKGNIVVHSKIFFSGEASYDYDNGTSKKESLRFDNFESQLVKQDSIPIDIRTTALGQQIANKLGTYSTIEIPESRGFLISEGRQFRGIATMYAWKPGLQFKGEFRLSLDGPDAPWLPLTGSGEITVGNGKINGAELMIGVLVEKGKREIYAPLIEAKRNKADFEIIEAAGNLETDGVARKNIIMPKEKKAGQQYNGNRFEYSKETGVIEFEGKLNLLESTEKFSALASGLGRGKTKENKFTINTMLAIGLEGEGEVFKYWGKQIEEFMLENRKEFPRTVKNDITTHYKMGEHLEKKEVDNFKRRFDPGRHSFSDYFGDKKLVFSDVTMNWSPERKAFYSIGDLGLANMLKVDIDAKVTGMIEIPMEDNNKTMYVYLEFNENRWLYLEYNVRDIKLLCSDEEFMKKLEENKSKDKYKAATPEEMQTFKDAFKAQYKKVSTPSVELGLE
ncbi:MAG: hypothetical protein EAZ57_03920 [Cytophagales bacterium]|nr:MAG: hypothetical protein EAZ67_04935 [Cytophagales bacterium]TAF61358.1 MAG: hypothetical protein EAZ57_03920 [Cytophagales bacterium]